MRATSNLSLKKKKTT